MIEEIKNMVDVQTFMNLIAGEIKDFHPMYDFRLYVDPETNLPRYTEEEAVVRETLMDKCLDEVAKHTPDMYTYLLEMFDMASDKLARTRTE